MENNRDKTGMLFCPKEGESAYTLTTHSSFDFQLFTSKSAVCIITLGDVPTVLKLIASIRRCFTDNTTIFVWVNHLPETSETVKRNVNSEFLDLCVRYEVIDALFLTQDNYGLSYARNMMIDVLDKYMKTMDTPISGKGIELDKVIFMDADCCFFPYYIRENKAGADYLVNQIFSQDSFVGLVGHKIVSLNDVLNSSVCIPASYHAPSISVPIETEQCYAPGYFMAVRASTLFQDNLRFDENITFWYEDSEFAIQIYNHYFERAAVIPWQILKHHEHLHQEKNSKIFQPERLEDSRLYVRALYGVGS